MTVDEETKQNILELFEHRSRLGYYRLADDGKTPIPVKDVLEWAKFFEDKEKRIVAQDHFGAVMVSTVFLGMDHGWHGGPPVLWETMVFGGHHDGHQERATSFELALAYHADAVAEVKHSQLLPIRAWLFMLRISRSLCYRCAAGLLSIRSRFAIGLLPIRSRFKKLICLFFRR